MWRIQERDKEMKKRIFILAILLSICLLLYASTDQTVVLTNSVERRNQEPLIKPVWEHVITATYSATDTGNITHALPVNGILLKVILVAPDGANGAVTYQVEIDDNGDNEIFDSGEQAETLTYTFNCYEPVTGIIDITIGPSAVIGDEQDIVVYLRGI